MPHPSTRRSVEKHISSIIDSEDLAALKGGSNLLGKLRDMAFASDVKIQFTQSVDALVHPASQAYQVEVVDGNGVRNTLHGAELKPLFGVTVAVQSGPGTVDTAQPLLPLEDGAASFTASTTGTGALVLELQDSEGTALDLSSTLTITVT